MKAASLNALQKELTTLEPKRVLELCVRLMKYKKENKELLTYLLFEAHDEENFIKLIKEETDRQFSEINKSNLYLAKKSIRKILRMINKFIRYSGIKETELELRIYYCTKLKQSRIPIDKSKVLSNLYNNQLSKIKTVLSKLHEDLQYEYVSRLEKL
jgi:gas vesicle protein